MVRLRVQWLIIELVAALFVPPDKTGDRGGAQPGCLITAQLVIRIKGGDEQVIAKATCLLPLLLHRVSEPRLSS